MTRFYVQSVKETKHCIRTGQPFSVPVRIELYDSKKVYGEEGDGIFAALSHKDAAIAEKIVNFLNEEELKKAA